MNSLSVASFDFGSGMPLPPPTAPKAYKAKSSVAPQLRGGNIRKSISKPQHLPGLPVRSKPRLLETKDLAQKFKPRFGNGTIISQSRIPSFYERVDQELLDYLQRRNVSSHFLHDIDMFLERHPELLDFCPAWCHQLSTLPPLEAYLFFVRGYLRPATYRDGTLPPPDKLVVPWKPVELQFAAFDSELLDFFSDCGECFNILGEMDNEIAKLANMFHGGRRLYDAEMKLMALVVYGQPVDALKFYEYCYQTTYEPHRFLPEHNVLSHLPRTDHKKQPKPCMRSIPRSFRWVRSAMAKANDANRDVIPVLLSKFDSYLAGFSHVNSKEIVRLRHLAEDLIDRERETSSGCDIVDMVMKLPHTPFATHGAPPKHKVAFPKPSYHLSGTAAFKLNLQHINHHKKILRELYGWEARHGAKPWIVRAQKEEEQYLVGEVTARARERKLMSDEEHEFLKTVFPDRVFTSREAYDRVNPNRYDVLILLTKWL